DPEALYDRAMVLAAQERFPAALDDLNRLLVLDPKNARALRGRGQVRGDRGNDLERSEEDLTKAIALDPNEPDGYRSRGRTRFRAEKWQGAAADWQEYLERAPKAPDAGSIYNDLSEAYRRLGKMAKATQALIQAVKRRPSPGIMTNLGNLFLMQGQLDRAAATFTEVLRKDDRHTRAWALRGQTRLRQGRHAEAVADLDQALKLGPGVYETLL